MRPLSSNYWHALAIEDWLGIATIQPYHYSNVRTESCRFFLHTCSNAPCNDLKCWLKETIELLSAVLYNKCPLSRLRKRFPHRQKQLFERSLTPLPCWFG